MIIYASQAHSVRALLFGIDRSFMHPIWWTMCGGYHSRRLDGPIRCRLEESLAWPFSMTISFMLTGAEKSGSFFPLYDIVEMPKEDGDGWLGLIP